MRFPSTIALLLVAAPWLCAQEKTVARYVEFRDGSIIRLPIVEDDWQLTVVHSTGKLEAAQVKPSEVENLILTDAEDFVKKRKLLSAVQQLGSGNFSKRERAYQELLKMGKSIRPDLTACLKLTEDVEIRTRIYGLLNELPSAPKAGSQYRVAFDRLKIKSPKLNFSGWGFWGSKSFDVVVNGKRFPLQRKDVVRVTASPNKTQQQTGLAGAAGFQRLAVDQFPKDCLHEPFENHPTTGRRLQLGEDIQKLFVPRGFVLSTSIASSHVSVNNFQVAGKSRGWSAATHSPLWQGEITVRFVRAGQEHLPAAVTHFGCYIAAVVPGGTSLDAYDLYDNKLGSVKTTQNNTDFLGVRSSVPIHKIRIVPNPGLDRDYTLDDFLFRFARATQATHPSKYTVHSGEGDLIFCNDVTLAAGKALLHTLPAGLPDVTLPLEKLLRVNAPQKGEAKAPTGIYAKLNDGSVIHAPLAKDARQRPTFPRRPKLLTETKNLIAMWPARFAGLPGTPPKHAAVWSFDRRTWAPISNLRLLEEIVLWKNAEGQFASSGYEKLPPLWFGEAKTDRTPGRWQFHTKSGEVLVVPADQALSGRLSQEVRVVWQGQSVTVSTAELAAISRIDKQSMNNGK